MHILMPMLKNSSVTSTKATRKNCTESRSHMAKFWFVSAPLFSHLDWGGYLATAQALQKRGHEVTWISENAVAGALAKAGVPFVPIRKTGWLWPPPPVPD